MATSGKRVTLAQVAAACGVSPMTVSNAYNRPDQLSGEVRRRVLATAERLGYAGPSPVGRALRRGRSDALGVLMTADLPYTFGDPGAVAFMYGVAAAAADAEMTLLLVPALGAASARLVQDAAIDGLIVFAAPDDDPALEAAVSRRVPLVVGAAPQLPGYVCVGIDDAAAAEQAARHVLGLGHTRIGVVTWRLLGDGYSGPVDARRRRGARYEVFRNRLSGYLAAAAAAGLDPEGVPVLEQPGNTVADGRAAGHVLLDRPAGERPTAVLASTDVLALGVLRAAHELGLRVPGDVSVVGFDDIDEAARTVPTLTTVRQSLYEQGRDCATHLLRQLAGSVPDLSPGVVQHPAALVVRASTDRPGRASS